MFDTLALDRQLLLALDTTGLNKPTDIQAQVIPPALEGRDLSICAPTGSGKTLAYLIPLCQQLLAQPARERLPSLVLVPTRELARQVLSEARKLTAKSPLQCAALTGGADFRYQQSLLRKNPDLIIATPGRLLDHSKRGSLAIDSVQVLVLDEADRMLDMGFRDDVLALAKALPPAQTLLLSATLAHRGVKVLEQSLIAQPQHIAVGTPRQAHADIRHQAILADSQKHKDQLLLALLQNEDFERALVFTNKRITTGRLAQLAIDNTLKVEVLHGEMSTEARKAVMTRFKGGNVRIVIASDLAARGLDVQAIDLVINYDIPHKGDDYVHRTGRTGRAGAEGTAISLVSAAEWNAMIRIERFIGEALGRRTLAGLKAHYKGPKKTKSSGKVAGSKRKKTDKKIQKKTTKNTRQTFTKKTSGNNDGFAPLKKKPR